jgi:hypothetical protein
METINNYEKMMYLKNKYKEINDNLLTIIDIYDDMIVNYTKMKEYEYPPVRDLLKRKYYYEIHSNIIQKTINELIEETCNKCQHDFITDYIDTGIDSSKKITYCTICEYTKP